MDIKELEAQVKRDFNNAMCVIGLSHTWVFVYLLVGKIASYSTFTFEGKFLVLITMALLLLGIVISRKTLWAVISRLLDFNQKMVRLQGEIVEKNRLAAITETTLALSHEINNPLMVMRGNIEGLQDDFEKVEDQEHMKDKLAKVRNHCERIRQITDKLINLTKPAKTTAYGGKEMLDAAGSE